MLVRLSAVTLFVVLVFLAGPAAADDAPYAPQQLSIDELIVVEQFQSTPLSFPWNRVSSDRVTDGERMNFELIYDVDYDTVRQALSESYSEGENIITLEPHAMQYTDVDRVRPVGLQFDDVGGRITVGHSDILPVFVVDIEPDGNRTRIIVQNFTRAHRFSGFVPARANYRPVGAAPIPFRGN